MQSVPSTKRYVFAMALGLIILAVDFIVMAIVVDGAEATRTAANITQFTGMSALIAIGPTIVFVVFLFGGIVPLFLGVRGVLRTRKGG